MDIKVYNASDEIDARRILSLFEDNNIKGYSRDSGPGGYMEITRGFSVYGKDIYVDEDDASRALELINISEPEQDDNGSVSWFYNRRIMARIVLVFVACILLLFGIYLLHP